MNRNIIYVESVSQYIKTLQEITLITNSPEIANSQLKQYKYTFNDLYMEETNSSKKSIVKDKINDLKYVKKHFKSIDNISSSNYEDEILSEYKYKFFYRGHYSDEYKLIPSVFRGKDWDKEEYYYHEIMVRCPEAFQNSSHLEKLVTMQHYDCPTRLLDITSNPLVALFFACYNSGCKKCDTTKEGRVFVFPVLSKNIAYFDSDKALMLSCLSRFNREEKFEIFNITTQSLLSKGFEKTTRPSYKNNTIERLFYEITTERPSFKREIKPIDILQPIFVQPNKTNNRIIKQDGAFILSGLSKNETQAEEKIKMLNHVVIGIRNREVILKELEQLGIHQASLFPEIDKVANYLKEMR